MEPFSRDELVDAVRPVLDEADAVELMEGAYAVGVAAWERARAAGYPFDDDQPFFQLVAMNLSEDTLILLALASERGARLVQAFRPWRQAFGHWSVESREQDDARWNARYEQLAHERPNDTA